MRSTFPAMAALVLSACGNPTGPGTPLLALASVSVGQSSTCGVTISGAAYCWGDNSLGQLGDNTFVSKSVPVAVAGGYTFAAVSVGASFACGITTGGAAYCWGFNSEGELGNGTFNDGSNIPLAVAGGLVFRTISAGATAACGVTTNGTAYCWGTDGGGELGDSTMTPSSSVPVRVRGGMTFKTVTAGDGSACGVTSSAAAYCWGDNGWGQLGNGTTAGPERCGDGDACSTIPVAVVGGLTFEAVTIAAAFGAPGHQACGVTAEAVTIAAAFGAPGHQACGVTASHAAYCWGANDNGQLGTGTPGGADTPVPVAGGLSFQSVGVGANFACGLTADRVTYCWGANDFGQLGNGTNAVSTTPVAIPDWSFANVSVGYHSGCGITTQGAAYCWGLNDHGQLGDGTTTDRGSPVLVVGSTAQSLFKLGIVGSRHE